MMMVAFSPDAQGHLNDYLRQLKAALAGQPSVDAGEVERDVLSHIDAELSGEPEPVAAHRLLKVLDRLGEPQEWVPQDQPSWQRPFAALQSRPNDWRLSLLAFGSLALAFILMLGSVMLWPMPLVLGALSFITARIAVGLMDSGGEAVGLRLWLLAPPLLLVYVPLFVVLAGGPALSLGNFLDQDAAARTRLADFASGSSPVAVTGAIALVLGCWWALLGLLSIQFMSAIRAVFRPFANGFGRRHATRLALAGVVLAVVGIAALTLPRFLVARVSAQERPRLTFEVASVKRNVSGDPGGTVRIDPGNRLVVTNIAVVGLVRHAYGTQRWEMVPGGNLPSWMETEKWDIQAKAAGDATPEQVTEMFKNLLADRFKLVANRELREIPVYALVRARGDGRLGPQLRTSTVDCVGTPALCDVRDSRGNITMSGGAWVNFPRIISLAAGRYIVDKTGISGSVDLQLTWTPDQPPGAGGAQGDPPPLFTAIQDQLGLRLEPSQAPVEVLVVRSAERPTED
jgi:uncharacterized protein (TIGR03435 family)